MSTSTPSAPAWIRDAICWQVYPLGFCDAPRQREDLLSAPGGEADDGAAAGAGPGAGAGAGIGAGAGAGAGAHIVHRLPRLLGWLDHLVGLGANVLLLNPIFDSVSHGYDTLDHRRLDPRLGDDGDFEALVTACHERGIRLVLDGVFNHVSDRHPLVRRAIAAGPDSADGARIRWAGEHPYGFEGNDDLVELNLADPAVQDEIVEVMSLWLERGADGWRLDAMYAAGAEAWRPILERVRAAHPEAWILGEVIHGDYPDFAARSGADSITQYELWKATWSAIHDQNLFELAHALGRHQDFLEADGGARPLTFVGNHDTTRIASQLPDGRDLATAVALLALLPGIPAVYAGDEFGAAAVKEERAGGDDAVRPGFPDDPAAAPSVLEVLKESAAPRILEVHRRLLALRRREPWLADANVSVRQGSLENTYAEVVLTPRGSPEEPGSEEPGTDGDGPISDPGAGSLADARPLVLALNLGEEDRPAPAEIIEAVSGADMLDAVGPPGPGVVPAHGAAVMR